MNRYECLVAGVACCLGLGWTSSALAQFGAESLPGQPTFVMEGVPAGLAANVRNSLTILAEPCSASLLRLQRLIPNAEREVTAAVNALGYYRSTFTLTTYQTPGCWMLRVDMQPGPRILLENVAITIPGDDAVHRQFAGMLAASPVRAGMPLDHGTYEDLKNDLSATAIDNGYFGARFGEAQIAIDLQAYKADVRLDFDTGNQYRFGAIKLAQPSEFTTNLLGILSPIEAGDFYANEQLGKLRRNLESSQYFRQVRITPRPNQAVNEAIPIDVDLTLLPQHAFSSGIGFTTDTGPRVRGSYENRYLNNKGHRLLVNSSLSQLRTELDASYRVPLPSENLSSLNFTGGYSAEDNDSYFNRQFKLVSSIRSEYANGWLQNVFLDFQRNEDEIELVKTSSVLSLLGGSLSKTSADDLVNPSAGWKLFAQVQGAAESLLSDTSLLQVYTSAKHIKAFGRSRVLSRLEAGATVIDETADLPANLRFFAGGDQSIRGYDFRALGPAADDLARDGTGTDVVGGKFLIVGSVEYDYLIRDKWRVAVFSDNGYVFNNKDKMELQQSAGLGVRWLSPLGPIRIDLAHAFEGDESFRIHITMGPDL